MPSGFADIHAGEKVGGLSGGGQHGCDSAFEGCNAGGYVVVGGVLEAGVEVAAVFEVEEASHLVAGLVLESGALDDWDLARFAF